MTYEVIEIDKKEITVDVSMLAKSEDMHFNATQLARSYGKHPHEWLRKKDTLEYIEALSTITGFSRNSLIITKTGSKYGGTWLHKNLAIVFVRWLDPFFAVKFDLWVKNRIEKEADRKRKRLEIKTGFKPMTDAIEKRYSPAKPYRYTNEVNMMNRIVLGMTAKQFKEQMKVDNLRDAITTDQLRDLGDLQLIDTGLIKIGFSYKERKEYLTQYHNNTLVLPDEVA